MVASFCCCGAAGSNNRNAAAAGCFLLPLLVIIVEKVSAGHTTAAYHFPAQTNYCCDATTAVYAKIIIIDAVSIVKKEVWSSKLCHPAHLRSGAGRRCASVQTSRTGGHHPASGTSYKKASPPLQD
jgi:hypothetical protein